MTITFERLIAGINKKGLEFEAFSRVFDRWGSETDIETIVSVKTGDYIWCTWKFYRHLDRATFEWVYNPSENGWFVGRYNQNTGKTIKSWKQERKAEEFILSA